jgi:release factor glutamine methyltransferase
VTGATNAGQLRSAVAGVLERAGVPRPYFESDAIIGLVLSMPRASLHAHPERLVNAVDVSRAMELSALRAAGTPSAYLLGDAEFCGRRFAVDARVLIPRTETEFLAQRADKFIKNHGREGVFADWCAGSGCIAITLLADNPGWSAYAVDSARDALGVSGANARAHGVERRITFIECSDPLEAGRLIPTASLDMIVSNPPYIPTSEIAELEPQVKDHEPRLALDGGEDGLDLYRLLMRGLPGFMRDGAPVFFETGGPGQIERIKNIAEADHEISGVLKFTESFEDHRGIGRFMVWIKSDTEAKI